MAAIVPAAAVTMRLAVVVCCAVLLGGLGGWWSLHAWRAMPDPFTRFLLFVVPHTETTTRDLNSDGITETYTLHDGRLTVGEGEQTIWQTPDAWWVDHMAFGDVTHDGENDIVLSVWKSGSYGSSQPFWVEENDPAVRNHLFVFAYRGATFHAVWQSSNLARPNCSIALEDASADGLLDLVVTEGEYTADFTCTPTTQSVWGWNTWGFFLTEREQLEAI